MPTIYVLLCKNNHFYVGKTDRPLKSRVTEHFTGNGSEWTQKYKPIKLLEQIPNADEFDEDKYTKMYMKQYGIDKVRGGSYTQITIPEFSRLALEKELCGASDLCYRCNRHGHFINQCYATTKADGSKIFDNKSNEEYSSSDEEYYSSDDEEYSSDDEDEECWCCEKCDKEFDSYSKAKKHEKICNYTKPKCYRCGRHGHYANRCYAS